MKRQRCSGLGRDAKMGLYVQNNVHLHRATQTRAPVPKQSIAGTWVHAPRTLTNFERNEEAEGSPWTGREENGRELFWTF